MAAPTPAMARSAASPRSPAADRAVVLLFGSTMVLSAALLFLVQPMMARFVLPRLGGTPAVWTASQMFFQFTLLGGYVYAHASIRWLGPRRQALLHAGLVVIPLVVLPLGPDLGEPGVGASPTLWLVGALVVAVGGPFFAISSTAPLVQRWLAELDHPRAHDPYFLYRASNVGSVLGLIGYPLLLEPTLGLVDQGRLWSVGYAILLVALVGCVAVVWRLGARRDGAAEEAPAAETHAARDAPPDRATIGTWVFLAAIPSSLMLGTTTFLSTDIAPFPLLWVLPLGLYLFTFVVGFSTTPRALTWVRRFQRALPVVVVLSVTIWVANGLSVSHVPLWLTFALTLTTMFVVGMACHGRLAAERPAAHRLTGFYLWVSVGGALGGTFNALLAPRLFDATLEYPLALGLALLALPGLGLHVTRQKAVLRAVIVAVIAVGAPALLPVVAVVSGLVVVARLAEPRGARIGTQVMAGLLGVLLVLAALSTLTARVADRDFFGAVRVLDVDGQRVYQQGTTVHGIQRLEPSLRLVPTSYYHPSGPLGDVVREARRGGRTRHVAVTGLGAGTAACLGARGESWRFFEIAPLSIEIASDPRQFTYLRDCPPDVSIVEGDARVQFARTPGRYGLVVMDAFSSDSIPVHLLTRQAVQLWLTRLAPDGILSYHITNRHLDLEGPVSGIARSLGMACRIRDDRRGTDPAGRPYLSKASSTWVALAREPGALGSIGAAEGWRACAPSASRVWTDDYSNVLGTLRH